MFAWDEVLKPPNRSNVGRVAERCLEDWIGPIEAVGSGAGLKYRDTPTTEGADARMARETTDRMLSVRPIVAVTCLSFEARIAAGPGVTVLCGDADRLIEALESVVRGGCSGIISFGIAGGLAPALAPGHWVVASKVVSQIGQFATDRVWAQRLLQRLPDAVHAAILGVDAPVVEAETKHMLGACTRTVAVDMESHVAARVAAAHGLPFAACRVIIDPAHRTLPPAALVGLRPDGTPDAPAVLRSLMRHPRQVPALIQTALDARAARRALLGGRRLLGPGLGFPDFGELQLNVA
jgi:hopanoid-associated phosphorylase